LAAKNGDARSEARNLLALVGRNGDTVDSIRELIAVPSDIERTLRLFLRQYPEDSDGVERVLEFRKRVAQEFEQLTSRRESTITIQDSLRNATDVPRDPRKQIESKPGVDGAAS
jgi:hypothetical protein